MGAEARWLPASVSAEVQPDEIVGVLDLQHCTAFASLTEGLVPLGQALCLVFSACNSGSIKALGRAQDPLRSTANLQRILTSCLGSHLLPSEQAVIMSTFARGCLQTLSLRSCIE